MGAIRGKLKENGCSFKQSVGGEIMSLTFNWRRKSSKDIHGVEFHETQWRASVSLIDGTSINRFVDAVMAVLRFLV